MEMLKVDKEGVPRIVQRVYWQPGSYLLRFKLFNGATRYGEPSFFSRFPPEIWDIQMTEEQHIDIYNAAEVFFKENWDKLGYDD